MAIKKLQGLDAIRRWVVKTFLKEKEQTGVMVNLPKKDFVDLNTSITAERLMRNGIDPNSIKSEDQVENIINQLNKPKVVSQGDPEFEGIMSKMLGSNVIKADFGKPFKEEIKKMRSDEEIVSNIKKSNERSVQNLRMQMMDDKVANDMFQGGPSRDPKTDADMLAEFIAEDAGKVYDDLTTKERLKFYDRAYNAIMRYKRRDPEDMADGGRIGFKKGMDRRTFMKMVGGLTALPILGKFFKGAEVAAPVAEKAAEIASGAPPYFFNLVDRIRALGKRFDGPKERSESYSYKDYQMDIDLDTGKIDIKKTKEAMIPGGDEAGISEEVYMTYKPGVADETTKGGKVVDEYEEFTARPDIDGKMKDVEAGVPDEVVEEGSISKEELEQEIIEQIARDKKASGGIAMMLGE